MSQKRREKLIRREARRKKVYRPGLSRAEQQAAFEERCAKRKAREAEVKALAEAERTKQRLARDAREQALADAVVSAILPAEGGTLRLVGLHDTHRYYYPPIVRVNDRDFIVAEAKNEAGDTWLTLKPKPEPKPGLNDRFAVENGVYVRFLARRTTQPVWSTQLVALAHPHCHPHRRAIQSQDQTFHKNACIGVWAWGWPCSRLTR